MVIGKLHTNYGDIEFTGVESGDHLTEDAHQMEVIGGHSPKRGETSDSELVGVSSSAFHALVEQGLGRFSKLKTPMSRRP